MSGNEHMERNTISNEVGLLKGSCWQLYIRQHDTTPAISVLAAKLHNLHSANGTATSLITVQIVSSDMPPPPCDSLVISECYTLTEMELKIDSLIPDHAIATRIWDRASDPLTECKINRVSIRMTESESDSPIEWLIARLWPRLSPTAFHSILA